MCRLRRATQFRVTDMERETARTGVKHICVCVCTYKRPHFLKRLLEGLQSQETGGHFTFSIVVTDNDAHRSAESVVQEFCATSHIHARYCVEPQQNIALARNRAVMHAAGDFLAFIDDDEEPARDWLLQHFKAMAAYPADGVLGPVVPRFLSPPPEWVLRGRFFERPSYPTGTQLRWKQTRSGNVLLRKDVFAKRDNSFREEFGRGGEDSDFFRRMIAQGMKFVWCAEAPVYETVPPERCSHTYLLKRALLRGRIPYNQGWPVLTSLLAVPIYALLLPFLLLAGHHLFMRYLIKECDHLGRILAFLGIDVVREKYVTG